VDSWKLEALPAAAATANETEHLPSVVARLNKDDLLE